jgi:3-phenylpropionate/trans-cinnamate dioxygenase ferredoxin reductase subunit
MQYVGHASGDDEVVLRGAVTRGAWSAFYRRGTRLRAALCVNRPRDLPGARALIAAGIPVDAADLADEQCNLKALARATGARR